MIYKSALNKEELNYFLSFKKQGAGVIKLFTAVIYECS